MKLFHVIYSIFLGVVKGLLLCIPQGLNSSRYFFGSMLFPLSRWIRHPTKRLEILFFPVICSMFVFFLPFFLAFKGVSDSLFPPQPLSKKKLKELEPFLETLFSS